MKRNRLKTNEEITVNKGDCVNTQILIDNDKEQMPDECQTQDTHRNMTTTLLFIVMLLALLVWSGRLLMDPETLSINNVRIEGEFRHLSPATLQTIVTDTVRGGFFNVNVETIRMTLLQNPWVHEVIVRRIWPQGLSVRVTEQIPIARWGDKGLLNADSEFFSPEQTVMLEGLPILNGPGNTYDLLLNRFAQIQFVLQETDLIVTSLTLNDRWAWEFSLKDGPKTILGKKDIENRIERFRDYLSIGLLQDLQRIEIIDMRYTNGFAVRWKKNISINIDSSGHVNHG